MKTMLSEDTIHSVQKDNNGLNDFHSMPDTYGIDIDKVGINRFRIPILITHKDGHVISHDAQASMYVQFPKGKSGINMSRLYEFLQEETEGQAVSHEIFKNILLRYQNNITDSDHKNLVQGAFLKLAFNYCVKQESLLSQKSGWQYYTCSLEGKIDQSREVQMFLTVHYEYSSTCPCSLSMSKQYESEYSQNLTNTGN